MKPVRFVAPFRPFQAENHHHATLEAEGFDWVAAIRMLSDSVAASNGVGVDVITDFDTALPLQKLRFATTERRLMLWNLEVCACYLESDYFDRDTVMLDSDQLVFGNLGRWFEKGVDLGIMVRTRPKRLDLGIPILNGVQFWAHRGKARLAAFYREALAIARGLPEEQKRWGADTEALRVLLEPLDVGVGVRAGLTVALLDYNKILEALSSDSIRRLEAGEPMPRPTRDVLDFRYMRKRWMRKVYEQLVAGKEAVA